MLASIVISTYNRAAALPSTLDALRRQDLPATEFEVLVIDDGSTDTTRPCCAPVSVPFAVRTYRLPSNRGVSAARNVGLRNASGQYLIMMSDDLLVPEEFIRAHVATLRATSRLLGGRWCQAASVAELHLHSGASSTGSSGSSSRRGSTPGLTAACTR